MLKPPGRTALQAPPRPFEHTFNTSHSYQMTIIVNCRYSPLSPAFRPVDQVIVLTGETNDRLAAG